MVKEITFGDPIAMPETIFIFSCIFVIFMVYQPQTDRQVKIFAAQPQTEFDSFLLLNVNIKHQVLGFQSIRTRKYVILSRVVILLQCSIIQGEIQLEKAKETLVSPTAASVFKGHVIENY